MYTQQIAKAITAHAFFKSTDQTSCPKSFKGNIATKKCHKMTTNSENSFWILCNKNWYWPTFVDLKMQQCNMEPTVYRYIILHQCYHRG